MKSKNTQGEKETFPLYSFYRPHDRATTSFKNEVVNLSTGEVTTPPSMTKQNHVAECDINNIIKSYKLTGQIRHMSAKAHMGSYENLPAAPDFQEAMNLVIQAENSFATLPSHVRSRFGNDPALFLSFMGDPSNLSEITKLGLLKTPPTTPTSSLSNTKPVGDSEVQPMQASKAS